MHIRLAEHPDMDVTYGFLCIKVDLVHTILVQR